MIRLAGIAVLLGAGLSLGAEPESPVPFPHGYREWAVVKGGLITPTHPAYKAEGGLHYIYGSKEAMEGYRSGKFPDGAVLVYELLETRESAGIVAEGPKRRVDVMTRDTRKYAATGGWGFERFWGGKESERATGGAAQTMCFTCHESQKARSFVFSSVRD
jgi:hypothetical protein